MTLARSFFILYARPLQGADSTSGAPEDSKAQAEDKTPDAPGDKETDKKELPNEKTVTDAFCIRDIFIALNFFRFSLAILSIP